MTAFSSLNPNFKPVRSGAMLLDESGSLSIRGKRRSTKTVFMLSVRRVMSAVLLAGAAVGAMDSGRAEVISPKIVDSLIFKPPHVAGDAEFDGHGPDVYVRVKFSIGDNTLVYSAYLGAKETESDWTEASGWSSPRIAYRPPAGIRVDSIPRQEFKLLSDTMSGHDSKTFDTQYGRVTV